MQRTTFTAGSLRFWNEVLFKNYITIFFFRFYKPSHYIFIRAVKSVLVMAGSLKRENPDKNENVVLIRALRDSNLPKFLSDDAVLFQVSDSF